MSKLFKLNVIKKTAEADGINRWHNANELKNKKNINRMKFK